MSRSRNRGKVAGISAATATSAANAVNQLPPPPAVLHGNYPGDQRSAIGQVMGPRDDGYPVTVVDAAYDADTNQTRLGLTFGDHSDRFTTEGA